MVYGYTYIHFIYIIQYFYRYIWKYLGVMYYDFCNSFANGLGKYIENTPNK